MHSHLGFKFTFRFKSKGQFDSVGIGLGSGSVIVTWEMRLTSRQKGNLQNKKFPDFMQNREKIWSLDIIPSAQPDEM